MTLVVAAAGLLGLLIGSFLNVVIARVPTGDSVVRPASRCPRCGAALRRRDNVPVLSWLALGRKCRDCRVAISARYPAVELGTALIFAVVAGCVGLSWSLPAYLYLSAIAVALACIDLDVKRLPDRIVLPSYPVMAVLLVVASVGEHRLGALIPAAIGGVVLFLVYGVLMVAKPGGMGFGDVKLAGVLGMALGWLGWSTLAVGGFLAFFLGGVVAVALLLLQHAGRRSRIPFGPYMLAGALIAVVAAPQLLDMYLSLFGLSTMTS